MLRGTALASWVGVVNHGRITLHVWNGTSFSPIPFQIDKRRKIHVNFNVGPGDPGYSVENCELGYFTELYDAPPGSGQGPRADFSSNVLNSEDEIVFLLRDAWSGTQRAPISAWVSDSDTRYEISARDPRTGANRYAYAFRWESDPPPAEIDSTDYVTWTQDSGPTCPPVAQACGVATAPQSSRFAGIATVGVHFGGNWITDQLLVRSDGNDAAPRADLLDRFQYAAPPSETETSWSNGGVPRFLGLKDGTVRVIRAIQGAQSGRRTTKYEFIYPTMFVTRVNLRVHDLTSLVFEPNHDPGLRSESQNNKPSHFWSQKRFDAPSADPKFTDSIDGACTSECDPAGFGFNDWVQVNSTERATYASAFFERRRFPVLEANRSSLYADSSGTSDYGKYRRRWESASCTEDGPPENDGGCSDPEASTLFFGRIETIIIPHPAVGVGRTALASTVFAGDVQANAATPLEASGFLQSRYSTPPPIPGPCTPTLTGIGRTDGAVDLSVASPSPGCPGDLHYVVYRALGSGSFSLLTRRNGPGAFVDYWTEAGRTYRYKTVAYNAENAASAESSIVSVVPTDTTAPPAPGNPSGSSTAGTATIEAEIPCTRDILGVNVYLSLYASGPFSKLNGAPIAPHTPLAWTQAGLQVGQTYYFVATTVDFFGNESAHSPVVSITINP